jgi:hypothetical protein
VAPPTGAGPFASWGEKNAAHGAAWLKRHGRGERDLARVLRAFFRQATAKLTGEVRRSGRADLDPKAFAAALRAAVSSRLADLTLAGAAHEWGENGPEGTRRGRGRRKVTKAGVPEGVSEQVAAYVREAVAAPHWDELAEDVRARLRAALQAGLENSETNPALAARIAAALGPEGEGRAALIARTEATACLNAGQRASQRELASMGLLKGREWLCVLDDSTRPEHAAANGLVVGVDEPFLIGGERCDHPGDPSLSPGQRCNCRCTVVSVLNEG